MFARHADGTVVRAFTSLGWVLAWLSIKNKHEPGFRVEDRTNFVVFNKYTGGNHFELTWLDGVTMTTTTTTTTRRCTSAMV